MWHQFCGSEVLVVSVIHRSGKKYQTSLLSTNAYTTLTAFCVVFKCVQMILKRVSRAYRLVYVRRDWRLRVLPQEKLRSMNALMSSEYECRRRMLIKRLDVTIQSFGWSDRAKARFILLAAGTTAKAPRKWCSVAFNRHDVGKRTSKSVLVTDNWFILIVGIILLMAHITWNGQNHNEFTAN